jgi:hypothetical protein
VQFKQFRRNVRGFGVVVYDQAHLEVVWSMNDER